MSDIQDYIEYIIKIHQTLKIIPPIHVYINRTNNRLVFKVKDGRRLESKMPETPCSWFYRILHHFCLLTSNVKFTLSFISNCLPF